jgi:hypothetical protein
MSMLVSWSQFAKCASPRVYARTVLEMDQEVVDRRKRYVVGTDDAGAVRIGSDVDAEDGHVALILRGRCSRERTRHVPAVPTDRVRTQPVFRRSRDRVSRIRIPR